MNDLPYISFINSFIRPNFKPPYLSTMQFIDIDPFPKSHRLVHNGGFPKLEALHCSLNIVSSTEIS